MTTILSISATLLLVTLSGSNQLFEFFSVLLIFVFAILSVFWVCERRLDNMLCLCLKEATCH
jgi:hypothetical protein